MTLSPTTQPMALQNLRIIDLSEALAGPFCTMILGDLGAEVIKVERPGMGDQSRRWGVQMSNGESAYFTSTNRNKRSITLNLKNPLAQEALHKLLAEADVFICNVPSLDSLKRLTLHPDDLLTRYPRLIINTISGYGHSGPNAGLGGYDLVAQGESGLMSVTGTAESAPIRFPTPIADMTGGVYSAIAILAALLARQTTGRGQFIDTSLIETHAAWLTPMAGDFFATQKAPQPIGNIHSGIVPYQVFKTADKPIIIAAGTDKLWGDLCRILSIDDSVRDDPRFLHNDDRVRNRDSLVPIVQGRLLEKPAAYWIEKLRAVEIPSGPINTVPDLMNDPHYIARGNLIKFGELTNLASCLRLTGTPPTYRRRPPQLGEHNVDVLTEIGYSAEQIKSMQS